MTPWPRVLAVSDLHGLLPRVPACDLLLVGGDVCPTDDHDPERQLGWLDMQFRNWLELVREDVGEVVGVAGNHDFVFEQMPDLVSMLDLPWTYLLDESAAVQGLNVYGTPWVPNLPSWAFHGDAAILGDAYGRVPPDTDIVLSHGPPLMYGDALVSGTHVGSPEALEAVRRVRPPALVCGHIHEGYGHYRCGETDIYNAAFVDEYYRPRGSGADTIVEVSPGASRAAAGRAV